MKIWKLFLIFALVLTVILLLYRVIYLKPQKVVLEEVDIEFNELREGSSGEARGKILAISIFLEDEGHSFTEEDKEESLKKLTIAHQYLETEAKKHGVKLEFINDWKSQPLLKIELDYEGTFEEYSSGGSFFDEESICLDQYIQKTIDNISIADTLEEFGTTQVIYYIMIPTVSTSHAYSITQSHFDEYAVIYSYNPNFPEGENQSSPATYAHETMHLFEVQDYYFCNSQTSETLMNFIKNNYDNDLLLTTYQRISNKDFIIQDRIVNDISPITAYLVGWETDFEGIEKFPYLRDDYRKGLDYVQLAELKMKEKDYELAYAFYLKAIEYGVIPSMRAIGDIYYYGNEINQNIDKAVYSYLIGAEKGELYSIQMLGIIYYNGTYCEKNFEQAYYWFGKGVAMDDTYSLYYMGKIYEQDSDFMSKDLDEADKYFKKAAELGFEDKWEVIE